MINFHGEAKRRSYFEGWYLKHRIVDRAFAIIPSFHLDDVGNAFATVQVITEQGSYAVNYPAKMMKAHPTRFCVKIGDSSFSDRGIHLNISGDGVTVKGQVSYGSFTCPSWDIMGPFRFLPNMQCNHGILSLAHTLSGALWINGEMIDFSGGIGYIEKDWGSSFPSSYLWTQCNWYENGSCSVMASIADIPFMGGSFTGCIAAILYQGTEYRMATYCGVRVCRISPTEAVLLQDKLQLHIKLLEQKEHSLMAPQNGGMTRTIHESVRCKVSYRFTISGKVLFDVTSENASFEQDEGQETKYSH